MFRYPDIYRIPVRGFTRRGKKYLTVNEVQDLLNGTVEIEEKLDGKRVRVPYEDYILFREDCKQRRTVVYNALPAWEIGFDVWDGMKFLSREEKVQIFGVLDIPVAPLLFCGVIKDIDRLVAFLGTTSAFGAGPIEGIVIKNAEKQLLGKIVDPKFDREVDESEHPIRRPYEMNRLDTSRMYVL